MNAKAMGNWARRILKLFFEWTFSITFGMRRAQVRRFFRKENRENLTQIQRVTTPARCHPNHEATQADADNSTLRSRLPPERGYRYDWSTLPLAGSFDDAPGPATHVAQLKPSPHGNDRY